jgi:hypothetical protein
LNAPYMKAREPFSEAGTADPNRAGPHEAPEPKPGFASRRSCCDGDARLHNPEHATPALSPGARVAVFLLSVYKSFVSPLLPSSCKFYPTCSEYARDAVARHGVLRGLGLGLRRLLRCRPFSPGGYDPVPDA